MGHMLTYRRIRTVVVDGLERSVYDLRCLPCGWSVEVTGWSALVAAGFAHKDGPPADDRRP